jgi:hypothetical protein
MKRMTRSRIPGNQKEKAHPRGLQALKRTRKPAQPASKTNRPLLLAEALKNKIGKGKRWTRVVPTKTTPTLKKPLQPRNIGLQKKKVFPKRVEAELTMMLAKSLSIMIQTHLPGTFVYFVTCRAVDVTNYVFT